MNSTILILDTLDHNTPALALAVQDTLRSALRQTMVALALDVWCAGWPLDYEFDLWRALTESHDGDGYPHNRLAEVHALSQATDGWFYWPETGGVPAENGPVFVPLSEWIQAYNRWRTLRPDYPLRQNNSPLERGGGAADGVCSFVSVSAVERRTVIS